MSEATKTVRIGCGGGFWGDSPEGARQIVEKGDVDYLVMDYLAEITMSILARMRAKDSEMGYAPDFVSLVMKPLARDIADKGIRVVSNAGGVNPRACRKALLAVFQEVGVDLTIAVVEGDDVSGLWDGWRASGMTPIASEGQLPEKIASASAYLGAFPIAAALEAGADIVLTGRCVDSAIALGPLIYQFGWTERDFDLLAAGSLAGHLLECGTQVTGGIVTDWRDVPGWDDMGFPVAICHSDGSFEITKPELTGGLITPSTLGEQVVYEVGDPRAYLLPDVTCDWSEISLRQIAPDRVHVSGARGRAPTDTYKVSATFQDGFRSATTMMIVGHDARERAETTGAAILKRTSRLIHKAGFDDFDETSVEILGAEASFGKYGQGQDSREVLLKIAVRHADHQALRIFARELFPSATSMAQSLTGFAGGRPTPQPVFRLVSLLVPKRDVSVKMVLGESKRDIPAFLPETPAVATQEPETTVAPTLTKGEQASVPLRILAFGRSGDKGDSVNIGILARDSAFVPVLRAELSPERVADRLAHYVKGPVQRFEWPGLSAFNFLLQNALGGGGVASLRHDPQGKAFAQILLETPISVPAAWLDSGGSLANASFKSNGGTR